MVYESDFYTYRRPYSRPLVSTYSVTGPATIVPLSSLIQARSYPHLPYVAHKRLVTFIHTPVHSLYHTGTPIPIRIHSRVRPSVLAAEYSRIRELPRSSSRSYTERYLNSKDNILFDDETREIRAKADSLMRRIHVFIPRHSPSDYQDEILPERMRSDDYIRRILGARKNVAKEMELAPWYTVPEQRNLGKGSLACVEYVGGKPHSRRRPYYKLADLRPSDVKSDVNLMSYYSKNRQAAANASPASPLTEREIRKARAVEPEWTAPAPVKKAASPVPEEIPEEIPEVIPEPVQEQEQESAAVLAEEKKKEKKEKKREKEAKEEALRKAKEFLAKQAEEARIEEERQRVRLEQEEEEMAKVALEKAREEARQAEIEEQERLEAERKLEEEMLEAERLETERIAEEERLAAEIAAELAAAAEEEKFAAQKAAEDERKKQEEEERLAAEAAAAAATDAAAVQEIQQLEEAHEVLETQQELEAKHIQPIVDEEPEIDEDQEEEAKSGIREETFIEEPVEAEGGNSQPEEAALAENDVPQIEEVSPKIEEVSSPQIEEVNSSTDDVWGDNEDA